MRRVGDPTSPANTGPAWTPIFTGSRSVGLEDRERGADHAALAVFAGARRARGEDELGAVARDVGRQQADVVTRGRVLDRRHDLLELGRELVGARRRKDVVESADRDEPDGHVTMLGFLVRIGEAGAQLGRHEELDGGGIVDRHDRFGVGTRPRRALHEDALAG